MNELDLFKIVWESGYVVKAVLLLLVAASAVSWAIIFFKRRALLAIEKNNRAFEGLRFENGLEGMFQRARALPVSPCKVVFYRGYDEFVKIREAGGHKTAIREHFGQFGFGALERAMQQGVNEVNEKMGRGLSTLASIGSISPFVGLFGTVWGIIDSFAALAGGGGTLEAVAPGIAEALVATAVGLAAAIPAVWFFNRFNDLIEGINAKVDSLGREFVNAVERSIV